MPYRITWEERGVFCKYTGHVTIADFVHLNEEVAKNPNFETLRYQLTDLLEFDSHDILKSQAEGIAALQYAQAFTNDRIVRAVVARDEGAIELLKHWVNHHPSPERVRLFASIAEARDWISRQLRRTV